MFSFKYTLKQLSNLFQTIEIGATDADDGANAIVSFSLHGETTEFFFFFCGPESSLFVELLSNCS